MDSTRLVAIVGGTLGVLGLVRALTRGPRSWAIPHALALGVLGVGLWLAPAAAGWTSLAVLALAVWVPEGLLLWHRSVPPDRGVTLTRVASALHPAGWVRALREVALARELVARGDEEEGRRRLEALAASEGDGGRLARFELHLQDGDWRAIADLEPAQLSRDPATRIAYLRALGEVDELDRLLAFYEALEDENAPILEVARIMVAAFAGRPDLLAPLLDRVGWMDETARGRWRAIALFRAGRPEEARGALGELEGDARIMSERPAAAPVGDAGLAAIRRLESASTPRVELPAVVTWGFVALSLLVFAAEMLLGADSRGEALHRLGALRAFPGHPSFEPWRVLAACVLHFGWLHLGVNVTALAVFGTELERELGSSRTLVVVLVTGPLAIVTAGLATALFGDRLALIVGASGVVMGLIGAQVGVLARRGSKPSSRARLRWLLGVIGLQVVVDVLTPEVSTEAHLAGAVFGVLVGLALGAPRPRPDAPWPSARARKVLGAIAVVAAAGLLAFAVEAAPPDCLRRSRECGDACLEGDADRCRELGRLCDVGSTNACVELAYDLHHPDNPRRDDDEALRRYLRGCELDSAQGCYGVARIHSVRGEPDVDEWLERACELGSEPACELLRER